MRKQILNYFKKVNGTKFLKDKIEKFEGKCTGMKVRDTDLPSLHLRSCSTEPQCS